MIGILNLFILIITYSITLPLSLYIGSVIENLKNYHYYQKRIIKKKKNDDIEDEIVKKEETFKNDVTENSTKSSDSENESYEKDEEKSQIAPLKSSLKQCFIVKTSDLKHPSKYFIYYSRFSLYIILIIMIFIIPKKCVPELAEIYTLKFWIPSILDIKKSIIGFIISIIFGQPWLDNPVIQMRSFNKMRTPNNHCCCCYCYRTCIKLMNQNNTDNINNLRKNSNPIKIKSGKKSFMMWNPYLHFNNKTKALIIDITRLFCSTFVVSIVEEFMFRYFFYRFVVGGFNYQFVPFSTWKWTAAILSNIALTHILYKRCYDKGGEWITGLVNGYLCTYSMVKQGKWSASVRTRFLINLYIGIFVICTKKYKYWY
ncbi:hypothetical protein BCR32DRAFT_49643 [Anaeromyces robustus]|uniref:CAAX prenyl protease 2/Lysostaphin resistance protein A-like domain-containing protein n=1 Tax=Anaeromyces robustus TaxID=1754192 RepID=A0A1Y1WYS9_9FUNG|nr:hypothetical protein BCR32DRAFT_49643 [Anaeromyces robustus]|eukprot:ORX78254.1 hypothetical protein BCR32DRAFT_49643 [Anaeromyces robustus]